MGILFSILVVGIIYYLLKNTKNVFGKILVFIIIVIVLAAFMAIAKV